jgi:hypothetical protein
MLARLTDRGLGVLRRAARTYLRGIKEHFTGRLSQARLRSVAVALETITGPHQPHCAACGRRTNLRPAATPSTAQIRLSCQLTALSASISPVP